MRAALFLFLLLTAATSRAQPVVPEPPRRAGIVPLAVGGLVGGVVTAFATIPVVLVAPVGDVEGLLILEAGYVLGAAGGVILTRRLLRANGSDQDALRGALLGGALVAVATAGLVWAIEDEKSDVLAAIPAAAALTLALPTALAVRGARLAPATLAAPTGERALGLSVRVGL